MRAQNSWGKRLILRKNSQPYRIILSNAMRIFALRFVATNKDLPGIIYKSRQDEGSIEKQNHRSEDITLRAQCSNREHLLLQVAHLQIISPLGPFAGSNVS